MLVPATHTDPPVTMAAGEGHTPMNSTQLGWRRRAIKLASCTGHGTGVRLSRLQMQGRRLGLLTARRGRKGGCTCHRHLPPHAPASTRTLRRSARTGLYSVRPCCPPPASPTSTLTATGEWCQCARCTCRGGGQSVSDAGVAMYNYSKHALPSSDLKQCCRCSLPAAAHQGAAPATCRSKGAPSKHAAQRELVKSDLAAKQAITTAVCRQDCTSSRTQVLNTGVIGAALLLIERPQGLTLAADE